MSDAQEAPQALNELEGFRNTLNIAIVDAERYLAYLKQVRAETHSWPPKQDLILDLAVAHGDAFTALGMLDLLRCVAPIERE